MDSTNVTYTSHRKKNNNIKIIAIIIVVLLITIGGIYMYSKSGESTTTITPTPTVTPIEEPTPTEKPAIDKSSVKIQVQNGTGTPGQAAAAVEALTKAGYTADNIKTGNAEEYNHTTTTISAQKGFEDAAEDVKKSLTDLYKNVEIDSSNLESSSEFNIVIITGGNKYEEPTKAASSSPTIKPTSATTVTVIPTTSATTSPTVSPTTTATPTPTP